MMINAMLIYIVVSDILVVDIFCATIMKNSHVIPTNPISLISIDLNLSMHLYPHTSIRNEYI